MSDALKHFDIADSRQSIRGALMRSNKILVKRMTKSESKARAPTLPTAKAKLLDGKKGLIVGIANDQSIAWGCAKAFRALGAEVAVTYVRARRERDEHRIVATALWPHVAPGDTAVVLPGRWATQLSLADDAVTWAPGQDHLVGSIAIRELDEDGSVVGSFASLAVFASDGRLRALSFGIRAPRHPVLGPDHIAFLSDDATLRIAPLRAAALQFPRVQVFDAPRPGVQHPR